MEFKEYVKNGRVIRATDTAYTAIYEAQGFVLKTKEKPPKQKPPAKEVVTDEGTKGDTASGGSAGDNGEGAPSGKSKGTKQ